MGWIIIGGALLVAAFAYAVVKTLITLARLILIAGVAALRAVVALFR